MPYYMVEWDRRGKLILNTTDRETMLEQLRNMSDSVALQNAPDAFSLTKAESQTPLELAGLSGAILLERYRKV
jgi:hypothetical protein